MRVRDLTSKIVIGLALLFLPATAMAASDGTLGATSTGTADISVTIPPLIQISNMADIAFGSYSGTGDLNGNQDVCIYTNLAAGTYVVTATGSGAANAFTVTDGSNTIAYNVYFNDTTGTTGEVQLSTGSQSAQQSGANTSSATCGGGDAANYHIEMLETNLQTAPAASYTGTLTLVVEPN